MITKEIIVLNGSGARQRMQENLVSYKEEEKTIEQPVKIAGLDPTELFHEYLYVVRNKLIKGKWNL